MQNQNNAFQPESLCLRINIYQTGPVFVLQTTKFIGISMDGLKSEYQIETYTKKI